jgi:hypothetical protein
MGRLIMSDNISSSVLFHITGSMKNLKGILKDGFLPWCCPEYAFDKKDEHAIREQRSPSRAIAMVCFCDLPLALIRSHLGNYGQFGIGLKKEWGIQNGLEPVIYSHPNGQTRAPMERLTNMAINDIFDLGKTDGFDVELICNDLDLIIAFTKRYRGNPWRKDKFEKEVTFYDEREWRYVPTDQSGAPLFLRREDYQNQAKRETLVNEIKANFMLTVKPEDIQFLIVPDDNHILELHEFIKHLYGVNDTIFVTTAIMTVDSLAGAV